jgi:hypothetical protein
MKRILLFSILACLFLIQGCATGQWINVEYAVIDPAPGGYVKNYTIGQLKTAFIGQEIIKVAICDSFQRTATANQNLTLVGQNKARSIQINKNSYSPFPITGTVRFEGKTYNVMNPNGQEWGVLLSNSGNIYNNRLYNYGYQMIYLSDSILISPDKFEYSAACTRQLSSSISFELIYAGKNDISLNTTYKEYSVNDLARPAFFQNITYQADAKQIRFKDFVIQIHDATNEKITYTIHEDGFNKNAESSLSATSPDNPVRKPVRNVELSTDAGQRYKGIKGIALKNGNVIEGEILSLNPDTVKIRTKEGKVLSYDFNKEVERFIAE